MSDNRTLAKGVMVGGVPVYNNVESTTDTTMPSTSFFKTEDVDGKPVIISRDNIMGIVKDCLGSILNGLTDQTTVTKVPTLNGNTLGASAVSTLASVLGVQLRIIEIESGLTYTNVSGLLIWGNAQDGVIGFYRIYNGGAQKFDDLGDLLDITRSGHNLTVNTSGHGVLIDTYRP